MLETESTISSSNFKVQKRAVTYARTSGDDSERDSLSAQTELCIQYAQERGYFVVASLKEDVKGVSGTDFEAPELNRALTMARDKEFDVLIVRNVKRFGRDVEKCLTFSRLFREAGIEIEYVWDRELNNIEFTSTNSLITLIKFWEAENEKRSIVTRLLEGRKNQSRAGSVLVYQNPPYGYKSVKRDGKYKLEIYPKEAKWVKQIFAWYVQGKPLRQIAAELTQLGVHTSTEAKHRQSPKKKKRGKAEWTHTPLRYILKNKTYIGEWHYNKPTDNPIRVEVPAIIDRELFEQAQARLDYNREHSRRNRRYNCLLSRRLVCGLCGYKITYRTKKATYKDKQYVYHSYVCPAIYPYQVAGPKCDLPLFSAKKVEAKVWEWMKSIFEDEKKWQLGLEDYQRELKTKNEPIRNWLDAITDEITDREHELRVLVANLNALKEIDSERATETVLHDIKRVEQTLDRLENKRTRYERQLAQGELTKEQIKTLEEFGAKIRKGLSEADERYDKQLKIVENLDVMATLTVENGKRVVHPSCVLPFVGHRILLDASNGKHPVGHAKDELCYPPPHK